MTDERDTILEEEVIEEIVEETPRRGRSMLLAALGLLVVLLAVLGFFLVRLLSPVGAPAKKALPAGLDWVRSIYGWGAKDSQQLYRPTDVAVAPDGTIWATDPKSAMVLGFNSDGSFKSLIHVGPPAKGPGRMLSPEGVGTDEQGNVYVADFGNNKVMVFSPANKLLREWNVPLPQDVAVRNGHVAVVSLYGVANFTTDGKLLSLWGTRGKGADQFDGPHGIAIAANGDEYVSDTQNARVKAYSKDGKLLWTVGGKGADGKLPKNAPFQIPAGMTLDGKGRIVVVDAFRFQLVVLDPAQRGKVVGSYGEYGTQDGFFTYPTGVAYDPVHDYTIVADTTNDRVQVVTIPGTAGSLVPAVSRLFIGPLWLAAVPFALLALAIGVGAVRRRRDQLPETAPAAATAQPV